MTGDARIAGILEALEVPRHRLLYVQASVDWMEKAGLNATQALADVIDCVSPSGTLVMPSYPFRTSHRAYLQTSPRFDVRRTPAAVGLLAEMFRRTAGSLRSLDPDFCVTARGAEAVEVVGASPSSEDPFGSDSAYQRMLARSCTLVGLGVSLNTTSFIHAIDSQLQSRYPAPVYESSRYAATVVSATGEDSIVLRRALRPVFQQLIKPSHVNVEMSPQDTVFRTIEVAGAIFFKWDLTPWAAWCLSHGHERAAAAQWPCWLTELQGSALSS